MTDVGENGRSDEASVLRAALLQSRLDAYEADLEEQEGSHELLCSFVLPPPASTIVIEQHPADYWPKALGPPHEMPGYISDDTGRQVWLAAVALSMWFCTETWLDPLSGRAASSAVELGAGAGLVSIVLARLGVARVIATDGNLEAVKLAQANAKRNSVADRVRSLHYQWGEAVEPLLAAAGESDGLCCPLIILSDVLYAIDDGASETDLERSVRLLVTHGGCKYIVHAHRARDDQRLREDAFAERLSDVGVWHQQTSAVQAEMGVSIRVLRVHDNLVVEAVGPHSSPLGHGWY